MKKNILYSIIASLLTAVAQAQNENVTWQTPANITGASDVSLQGADIGTWAPYDGNAINLPLPGVKKFQGYSTLPRLEHQFSQ